jgi:myo-inositol-1(or 4)-monophosphatase
MTNPSPYSKELKVAKAVALRVGGYLAKEQKKTSVVKRPQGESFLDVTTAQDLDAEKVIIATLRKAFPDDHILSEETLNEYETKSSRTWIVDPLDGTTNYVKGLDAYGVSIALLEKGRVVLAVVYLPITRELYHSVRGNGVYLGRKELPMRSMGDTLEKSLVSVGFPHTRTGPALSSAFELYKNILHVSSDLRRSASAAFDTCLLASGKTGAYVTPDIKPWDIAAGILFTEEQGGVAIGFDGGPIDLFKKKDGRFSTSVIFAKNEVIAAALLHITKEYSSKFI